jgi:hypothetical protein
MPEVAGDDELTAELKEQLVDFLASLPRRKT